MAITAPALSRRALSKERRRQQLIDATIKCISRKGLGSTTLANVASEAGLSQGIVNLHFNSKDNLLNETLRYLVEDYDTQFMLSLERAAPDAASKLQALLEMDMSPSICDRKKLSVWFAFWGEVKSVPTYQKMCAANEERYDEIILDLCEKIIREGNYQHIDARTATGALSSMTDGLWLSCLVNPKKFDRRSALTSLNSYLKAVFPNHYSHLDQ